MRPYRIALTGGPCAGKSTAIDALHGEYGERVVTTPEAATLLLAGGYPSMDSHLSFLEWLFSFQRSIGSVQLGVEDAAVKEAESRGVPVVVFDRGLCDSDAYMKGDSAPFYAIFGMTKGEALARYDMVIHLESVATCRPELYGRFGNKHRMETLEEAQEAERNTLRAWEDHPNRVVVAGDDGLEAVVAKVLSLVSEHLEFEEERKFLLADLPEFPDGTLLRSYEMEQGYLGPRDARLRRRGDETLMTVKGEGGRRRPEWERHVPEWVFNELWPTTEGLRVAKTRYEVEDGGGFYEVDLYHGALAGLVTVELSGGDLEAGLPEWMGRHTEVTEDPYWRNRALASGAPDWAARARELLA